MTKQRFIALQLTAAALQFGFSGQQIGLQLLNAVAQVAIVHAGNRLARHHLIALIHQQLDQLALALGADVDPVNRVQLAGGGNHPGQGAGAGEHREGADIPFG